MSANLFIVPHDFTSVGDTALNYALFLAKPLKSKIILLHIVNNEADKKKSIEKLKQIISNLNLSLGSITIEAQAIKGSIFDDIPEFAQKNDARLIIMGTHGAKGMQKLFGSYAMKVVTKSSTPFLVVQDGVKHDHLKKILVPINFSKESLQVVPIAGALAKMFDSKITILAEKYSDSILYSKLKVRFTLVEKQFAEMKVDYDIQQIKLKKSYQKEIINYAKKNDYDLIAISHDDATILSQFDRFTQGLIANEENLPCLVVNAKLLTSLYY